MLWVRGDFVQVYCLYRRKVFLGISILLAWSLFTLYALRPVWPFQPGFQRPAWFHCFPFASPVCWFVRTVVARLLHLTFGSLSTNSDLTFRISVMLFKRYPPRPDLIFFFYNCYHNLTSDFFGGGKTYSPSISNLRLKVFFTFRWRMESDHSDGGQESGRQPIESSLADWIQCQEAE